MKIPPFCPNPDCQNRQHTPGKQEWYVRNGHYHSLVHGTVQRYRCRYCGTHFSTQTFSLDYRVKRRISFQRVFALLISSAGIRDIGRILKASPNCITNRISRLARQALAVHAELVTLLPLQEDLVADGFESFAVSQYFPNNIQLLLGKESQFWIYSDYAHIRRKGRMTERQKQRNEVMQRLFTDDRVRIYESFASLLQMVMLILERSDMDQVMLYTDMHTVYKTVFDELHMKGRGRILHRRLSSKLPRTVNNDLFSVNYIDREIRKDMAEHTRETVQFAHNVVNQMERLAIYRFYHNYLKPYRIRGSAQERCSHAERAGIPGHKVRGEQKTFFTQRRFLSRTPGILLGDVAVWNRSLSTPLRKGRANLPRYALA